MCPTHGFDTLTKCHNLREDEFNFLYLVIPWFFTLDAVALAEIENAKLGFHIDGVMQKRRNSTANALELCLFCIKPSTYIAGLIQGLHPANNRCCYQVKPSLISWAQT